jgi:hypothetical protein
MSNSDHARLLQAVARHFFGEPNQRLSKKGEMRFGNHGSLAIYLEKGVWSDYEANEGGGPLDLIKRQTGISETHEAYAWAEREGYWVNGDARESAAGRLGKEVAHYPYVDEGGELLLQVVRFAPKTFRQRRPDGKGGWIWNIKGVRRVPYCLPDLLEALGAEQIVFIVEGEKDVDNLCRLGARATCNLGGAGKWHAELNQYFAGADVVIIGDHDLAGRDHVRDVAAKLMTTAARIRVIEIGQVWPQCPDKGDVSDWIAAGLTIEALNALVAQLSTWSPTQETTSNSSNAGALKTMTFQPIKYVVPSIIVEGLTLLAGKPKLGKSWLLLHAAIAVARGGFTLGELHCIEGDVLYCALEDNLRRLQSRMTKLLGLSQDWPTRLDFRCEMPRLAEGGLDVIKAWIKSKTAPRLIIIDTLAMVKAPKQRDQSNYDADYAAVLELRALANEAGIAIVLVHHLRKAEADDAFDTVSGTLGLTGAPDTVLVLKRDTSGTIVLHGRGRDLTEIEMAMSFDQDSCLWRITGDAEDVRRSAERRTILTVLDEAGEPIGPNDIAAATGMRATNVRFLLGKLLKEGTIEKVGYGKYRRRAAGTGEEAEGEQCERRV